MIVNVKDGLFVVIYWKEIVGISII
jgi:hypothetical protein